MVSKVQQVAAIEAQIQDLQKQREEIINSPGYQTEAEFNGKLNELLGSYGKGLKDVIAILDPDRRAPENVDRKGARRARTLKRFKNPHTGEVVETKGGNHKTLKEWKEKWGADTVKGWAQ
ncbi:transcriptional regulator [Pseudomonas sp. NC26]|jgi:hypothetical protein|uniref:DNA-binding domain of the bacterial xenogeneic silencer MvaT n=2 Tax=Pseudomonas TaxID=286 RepID=A0A7G8AA93_PSEAI|nr:MULTISPECIES: histone-like nucleoid-structuring protein, MvaT/MvaU family [Pseudomonas]ALZ46440.1 Hypothetical protein [Pseudomonas putida]MBX6776422.1 transcriptional regulator [Pseudomonas aeruginosa]MDD2154572.1 transcriptional regulator [Pseudomonas putida]MEC4878286.1 transcriptional regulator [Pseudomonas sp. NC26]QNI15914.1 DNA-binding domain of the bacterial xenogeneic silencer MvaT [Pseudomonas aeruginosa]